jgi:hypothetical protein
MRRAAAIACMLLLLVLGACSRANHDISTSAATTFRRDLAALNAAVAARNPTAAATALTRLRQHVAALRAYRQISAAAGTRVLAAADAVQAQLHLLGPVVAAAPSTTTTTTTAPQPPPAPPGHRHHGKGGDNNDNGD